MRFLGYLLLSVGLVSTPVIPANQNHNEGWRNSQNRDYRNWEPPSNPVDPPDIRPQELNRVSLDPRNWYFFYAAHMPAHPFFDRRSMVVRVSEFGKRKVRKLPSNAVLGNPYTEQNDDNLQGREPYTGIRCA